MYWLILIVAGLCECGFTTCLALSNGLTKTGWAIAFVLLSIVSFWSGDTRFPKDSTRHSLRGLDGNWRFRNGFDRHYLVQGSGDILAACLFDRDDCLPGWVESGIAGKMISLRSTGSQILLFADRLE